MAVDFLEFIKANVIRKSVGSVANLKVKKMIIFRKYKLLFDISGLDRQGGRKNTIARIIYET